jgi:hypothetical protein
MPWPTGGNSRLIPPIVDGGDIASASLVNELPDKSRQMEAIHSKLTIHAEKFA